PDDTDRAVAAHPDGPDVVEIDDSGHGAPRHGRRQESAHDRVVAAGLEHDRAPEVLELRRELLAAAFHRGRGELRPPADDDAGRLSLGVRVDDLDRLREPLHTGSFVGMPSTSRHSPRGFSSRSSSGSPDCGKSWKQTGRTKRWIAAEPTEVSRESVVAGYGPPCCIAWQTSTPVGKPLKTSRPTFRRRTATSSAKSERSFSVPWIVAVRWPCRPRAIRTISWREAHRTATEAGP